MLLIVRLSSSMVETGSSSEPLSPPVDNSKQLFDAVEAGSQRAVLDLMTSGRFFVNQRQKGTDLTPMHITASRGHKLLAKSLIGLRANLEAVEHAHNLTPLLMATKAGHTTVVEMLLSAKANPDCNTKEGEAAINFAAHMDRLDLVQALLRGRANPNGYLSDRTTLRTPLMEAARLGRPEMLMELLRFNADPNIRTTKEGWTALFFAVQCGHPECTRLLMLNGSDISLLDKFGQPVTQWVKRPCKGEELIREMLAAELRWKMERVLWIGFRHMQTNKSCLVELDVKSLHKVMCYACDLCNRNSIERIKMFDMD